MQKPFPVTNLPIDNNVSSSTEVSRPFRSTLRLDWFRQRFRRGRSSINLPPISLGPMDLENDSLMAVATKEQGTKRLMHVPANVDGTQQAMSFSLSDLGENKGEEEEGDGISIEEVGSKSEMEMDTEDEQEHKQVCMQL